MMVDFKGAFARHQDDADLLYRHMRWENADQLYGLAAECGLKFLMQAFGMELEGNAPKLKEDRRHINELWGRYEHYQQGRPIYALSSEDPFQNWNVSQRYCVDASFDQARVDPHRAGACEIAGLLQQAEREGLLQ
ncbi:MAG: SAM-dependent methyltransferase [Magnetococcales bacterium]|nr:SAM-dependent methyltransferase [Magnetococcales bacterium]MBF0116150.1 SAM-dependent methyltransferase [Magnetococcales bacterium]